MDTSTWQAAALRFGPWAWPHPMQRGLHRWAVATSGLSAAPPAQPGAVLLLATPKADRKRHLEVLAAFARIITSDVNLREQLYHARSAAHAYDVLHADEAEDINYFLEDALTRAGITEERQQT